MSRYASRSEGGAVMIEVAMIIPLLVTLFLGVAEVGFHVRDSQRVVAASQAGARVVSTTGADRFADFDALMSMAGPLADFETGLIERIIIFKPTGDGSLPAACENVASPGICNHYDEASLTLTPADFTGTTTCGVFDPDTEWCPTSREDDQGAGTDWIGVRIEVRHESIAPFLPDRVISDTTVMRIEPRFEP